MSFRANGSRRYGSVPPQQYGPPGTQDSNYNPGLHRQSSFDNGDDGAGFDSNGNRYQSSAVASSVPGRTANMPQEEMFLTSPVSQSPRSPGQSTFGSSAMSGYQHQYQPFPGAPQSPGLSQVPYNPQNFARTQSQSQANPYRPQPAYNLASPTTASHQPYNPALYQAPQPGSQPARHGTVSGYNTYQTSYNSPALQQVPASPSYWPNQSNMQQYPPPVPSRPYEQPLASPTYNPSSSAPLPSRQPLYNPPPTSTVPYPTNGDNYGQGAYRPIATSQDTYPDYGSYSQPPVSQSQPAYSEDMNSFGNRTKPSSSHSNAGSSLPPLSQQGSPSGSGLQRHPTLRPLPSAPVDSDTGDDDDWGLHENEGPSQEQLFADIGDALGSSASRRGRPQGIDQRNGDLLDSELQDLHRYDSRATTIGAASVDRYASNASTLHNREPTYNRYADDEESDLEAAAGLEAMRIAEEQDQMGGALSFGTYEPQAVPSLSQEESSDSDYKHMDLGLVGGGYDAHMSYGDDLSGVHTGHSSEMDDQSRPLPTPQELGRSDSYSRNTTAAGLGGMTDYSIPGVGDIHPFPAFEAARVDTFGTGGLQRPTSQSHRLSFDEGDEQVLLHHRLSDSRQSGRSGSDSPSRDDMPELFYHPGMGSSPYNRPLPAVPPLSENRTPQLLPAGSYRAGHQYTHSYSSSTEGRPYYPPSGPDAYPSQSMLTPGGQYVPRSSSLSSHSSTPQTVPPVRSKTDAEERQARQKAARLAGRPLSGLDGYDMGTTPQSSMTLDLPALPAGRRKKFSPTRLSTTDYAKCREPWALSGIAAWIREMAGGETGEGESDLRQKTIEDGLVALFTHKVPTMNTADAETLSQRVVKSMFDADILLPEEEWVKFGGGEISGVLWQLTGSGCYAPKVHEQEIHGRCYSHHCTRTLKKINLQTHVLEPSRKSEDWVTFFKLTKESLEGTTKKEIERQNNLHEIVMSEDTYMDQINVLRVLYRDDLASWQPPIIAKNKITKFISSVFGKIEAIKEVNENYLLAQLKYRQKEQGPWIIGFSDIFREWIRKARSAYVEYAAGFPYAVHLVRKEADRNLLFRQFLDQARDNKLSGRLDWNTYLKAPITRLQRYTLLLGTVLKNMTQDTEEKVILATAIEEIKAVTLECDAKVDEQSKKVELIELQSKLYLRPGMERVELNLDHLGRELIFKGDLQRAGANRFTWLETHAILFDHYLVLAKTVAKADTAAGRKKEVYDVSKLPIPMQLLVLESTNDDPVVKSSVKGLGAVTTVTKTASASDSRLARMNTNGPERQNTLEHTQSNQSIPSVNSVTRLAQSSTNDGDAKSMYPFRVKHLGKTEVYTLYAPSAQNRQDWCEKILEAKTRHAASLFEQNAEPFRLRVMADSAFAYDVATASSQRAVVSVQGTPLDRAIREMEKSIGGVPRPGAVCRAQVNCATAFNCYGKSMVAIGTDYGVFTSEASNPRGWTRSIQMNRVTQIAVLEEFSLCLIIADKALIAYHLDVVVPISNFPAPHHDTARRAPQKLSGTRDVSFFATARMKDRTLVFYKKREGLHSTFKVLEPVFQKSTEKKSRLFGKKFGGTTEFFREFDEFYIPTECFTINLFHTYIAISTLKGFELMTLDKKVPMSIPDTKNPQIGNIAARLQGQKPLGMFRLSDAEFLLCYEECGVYVDKHGEVSRSVIMEFVGKAKTAAMYGAYLVLFDSDFVEVRNAENGRLRQVIAGRDVRCLDYGINPLGAGGMTSQMTPGGFPGGAERRTLKLAMSHPEIVGSQIVLEMVLNEGHSE
ncbi:rhoGEF protein-like protein [Mollisia scopiformis]|uniref:RhoGEF protein-like protein n=1 Tax=Mollisia scopiformis TaxID=149040 RepID=A0A132BA88_MOLSC|nr:rhoGEF protein-like protein [Mollisia scopiformis]KUJ09320.1 rhoGEF protein-like protein [Mollisia scopiformis]